jgi:hypothetical protein
MPSRSIVAALVVFLAGTGSTSAQTLSLEFHDGLVRLTAENVPVSRILAEWARVGGTNIVNGERVPGAPVTLQMVDTPERQALDTVLRGAAGYMALARGAASPGASAFDKILVLPTTSRAPAAAPPPAPQPTPQPPRPMPETAEVEEADENPQGPVPPPGFPRGRAPAPNPQGGNAPPQPPQENEGPPANVEPPAPAPGNPFGIAPGNNRPGTINKPPPREQNEQTPPPPR